MELDLIFLIVPIAIIYIAYKKSERFKKFVDDQMNSVE